MSHIITLVTYLVVITLCACTKPDRPEALVREWIGKEIRLPDDALCMVQGDTVQYDPAMNDYNIVMYVDSAGCTECKMRMPAWNAFMSAINQYDAQIGLCTMVDGVDASSIAQITKRNDFRYPAVFLRGKSMEFPREHLYQTFLLDDSGKVVCIGNPIGNESIARLYRRIVGVPDEPAAKEDASLHLVFSAKRIPLGVIRLGEEKKTQVYITNNGDTAAVISKIATSCHCTSACANTDTIHPGRSVTLDIVQRNDSTDGYFNRDIDTYVYMSNNPDPVQIELTGYMSNQSLQ